MSSRCHVQIVDPDGHVEACNNPTEGTITVRDDYGRPDTYPVCAKCMTAAMEGIDDDV